jgi:hypothetical protein
VIIEQWYGTNAADNISMQRIQKFFAENSSTRKM